MPCWSLGLNEKISDFQDISTPSEHIYFEKLSHIQQQKHILRTASGSKSMKMHELRWFPAMIIYRERKAEDEEKGILLCCTAPHAETHIGIPTAKLPAEEGKWETHNKNQGGKRKEEIFTVSVLSFKGY